MFKEIFYIYTSIISGVLFFLSFPKFGTSLFAWVCFVPLLLSVFKISEKNSSFYNDHKSTIRIILYSLLTGILGYMGIFYWVVPTFVVAGENIIFGIISLFLLSIYCGSYVVLFFLYVFNLLKKRRFNIYFTLSCSFLWVLLEYLRGYFLSGFPWMLLGYSQYDNINLIQISEIFGVYFLSLLIILFNLSISFFIYGLFTKKYMKECLFNLVFCLFLILIINFYGSFRLKILESNINKTNKTINLILLQGNIDQYKKWDEKYINYIMETYSQLVFLSFKKILENNDIYKEVLFVWPESSVPGWLLENQTLYSWMTSLVMLTNNNNMKSYHLVGSVRTAENKKDYFNSAVLFFKNEKGVVDIKNIYDKIHLVPFGEYVPFRSILGKFINTINELGEFTKGNEYDVFSINDKKFSVLICYESIFPELTAEFRKYGAEFFLNITNDAWFLKTSAPYQHFIFNVFRAIENRCYFVRAANTGISGIIKPTGEIINNTELFETTFIFENIPIYYEDTFYSKYSRYLWILYLLLLLPRFIIK
ncbi:MAG: apolipoprotein N-acyltransferase [Endomicrobia bacterium]|nr:apolipoprotein N-acyltransferase [Endomicrobiia bacterium]